MANFAFTEAKRALLAGEINLATDDLRVLIGMTNTTADVDDGTGIDAATLSAITLDEADGSGYVREQLGSGAAVTADNGNNRGEFDASDITFPSLVQGTRQFQALIVYKHVGADSSNVPIAYIDDGFPLWGNGADLTVQWNAQGILQAT